MLTNLQRIVPSAILDRCALVPEGALPTGLFHISANPDLKVMTPMIPKRTLNSEDATFPRVCVSSSWLGCVYGHSATLLDYEGKSPPRDWLGGYVIFRTPFKYALRPHTSLLSDVNISDEHWLFDLGDDVQSTFATERVGECFISSIEIDMLEMKKGVYEEAKNPVFYLELLEDDFPLILCGGELTLLKAGWYEVQLPYYAYCRGVLNTRNVEIRRIKDSEYREAKYQSLVMLSHNPVGSWAW